MDLNRAEIFSGAACRWPDRLGVTAEIYAAPPDAVTARLAIRTAIGPH